MPAQPDLADVLALPEEERFLARIEHLLRGPDLAGHEDVAEQVIRFLRAGSDLQVLQNRWGLDAVRAVIDYGPRMLGADRFQHEPFDVYAWFDAAPFPVALRWAVLVSTRSFNPGIVVLEFPSGAAWLGALISHVESVTVGSDLTRPGHLAVERLLTAAGLPDTTLLHALFTSPGEGGEYGLYLSVKTAHWPGFSAAVQRHGDTVRGWLAPAARPAGPGVQLRIVRLLELLDDATLAGFASEVAELAVSGYRDVRTASADLVERLADAIIPQLKIVSRAGKAAQRAQALGVLLRRAGQAGDTGSAATLLDQAASDRSAVVRAVAEEHRPRPTRARPRLPDIRWAVEITPEVEDWARALIETINAERGRIHRQYPAAYGPPGPPLLGADHVRELLAELAADRPPAAIGGTGPGEGTRPDDGTGPAGGADRAVRQVIRSLGMGPLELPAAVTALRVLGCPLEAKLPSSRSARPEPTHEFTAAITTSRPTPGTPRLLHAAAVAVAFGLPPSLMLNAWCHTFHRLGRDWPASDVEPYFAWLARTTDAFIDELNRAEESMWGNFDREALFRAAGMVADKPKDLADWLFAKALGPAKRDRALAQKALAQYPDKESRITESLRDGRAEMRTQAAAWLGRLRHRPASGALERAAETEEHEVARGAIIDALELLGRPVKRYLDRGALAEQAITGLAKGLPPALAWFDWDRLPAVHWARAGKPVPDDVVRWWLVQTVRLKSSEPGALLRKYCAMLAPADRERLGQVVLEEWIRLDDAEHTQRQPGARSMAVTAKGVLALAAACCGRNAVQVIERFVVTHYGNRPHQGRALIGMLPWIDHPSAVQLLLTLRKRFRTASFQEEAAQHIDALAQRHGWTVDELADRTLPDASFDATGRLLLPYGSRTLSAVLRPDLTIELRDAGDARIAALPAPRATDDETLVAAAKKAVNAARKEIKTLVRQQTDRLHEAMCVHREWPFEDWDAHLNRHPVVRHLVQRLVWTVVSAGDPVVAFRPLDDGTLTDVDDAPVSLGPGDRIRLAHDLLLAPGQVEAWARHVADYQVAPLFAQLGRTAYRLPGGRAQDTSLTEVDGAGLEAFTLRSRAAKLGYQRSAPIDGPFFDTYTKRFPGAGLAVELQFSGNELPEENKPVTLTGTSFTGPDGALRLGQVPAVLLAECRQDLFDLAGISDPLTGSGVAFAGHPGADRKD